MKVGNFRPLPLGNFKPMLTQALSVISAGLGLIGLVIAYKVLISNRSVTTKGTTTRVPTIT
jgi:hypothetical protein